MTGRSGHSRQSGQTSLFGQAFAPDRSRDADTAPGAGAFLHGAAVTALPDSEIVRPMIALDRLMTAARRSPRSNRSRPASCHGAPVRFSRRADHGPSSRGMHAAAAAPDF